MICRNDHVRNFKRSNAEPPCEKSKGLFEDMLCATFVANYIGPCVFNCGNSRSAWIDLKISYVASVACHMASTILFCCFCFFLDQNSLILFLSEVTTALGTG